MANDLQDVVCGLLVGKIISGKPNYCWYGWSNSVPSSKVFYLEIMEKCEDDQGVNYFVAKDLSDDSLISISFSESVNSYNNYKKLRNVKVHSEDFDWKSVVTENKKIVQKELEKIHKQQEEDYQKRLDEYEYQLNRYEARSNFAKLFIVEPIKPEKHPRPKVIL